MPRKNSMPESEIDICRRLSLVRLQSKLSRVAFANEVGVDSGFLSNIEYARAPVRYPLAAAVCGRFNISQRWLAEGKGEMKPFSDVAPDVESQIPNRALFSEAYQRFLRGVMETRAIIGWAAALELTMATFPEAIGSLPVEDFVTLLGRRIKSALETIPSFLHGEFVTAICRAIEQFVQDHKKDIQKFKRRQSSKRFKGRLKEEPK